MFTDIGFDTISIIHPFASAAADSHIGSLNDYSFQSRLCGGLYTLLISYLNPAQILTYIVPSALLPYTYILSMYISTMLAGIFTVIALVTIILGHTITMKVQSSGAPFCRSCC